VLLGAGRPRGSAISAATCSPAAAVCCASALLLLFVALAVVKAPRRRLLDEAGHVSLPALVERHRTERTWGLA